MTRRLLTAGLAAAFAVPAFAQQGPVSPIPVSPQPAETQPVPGMVTPQDQRQQRLQQGGAPQDTGRQAQPGATGAQVVQQPSQAQGAGTQQSRADAQHINETLAAGTVTLQAAHFADSKAQNPRVKQFAGFERDEQNVLADVIHSLADPAATASTRTGAAEAASTAPTLSDQASALMERMSRAQPGPDFDRDFVRLQIDRHQELLAIQERYLGSNPQNRAQANIAKLAQAQIREHLAILQDLQKELGH